MEIAGLAAAFLLRSDFGRWCVAYAALMIAYSLLLKRIPFLEALIVAAGMPLRALAGAALAGVTASNFLLICAYLLALFLVVGQAAVGVPQRRSSAPPRSTGRRSPPTAPRGSTTSSSSRA